MERGDRIIPLHSLLQQHKYATEIISKLDRALDYFPEVIPPIYIGITDTNRFLATVNPSNQIIFWRLDDEPTYITAFHEIAHIAVYLHNKTATEKWPKTEEFASIFAISRMPPELVDEARVPYIGVINEPDKGKLPELCRKALEYRNKGHNYIQFLRKQLEKYNKGNGLAILETIFNNRRKKKPSS